MSNPRTWRARVARAGHGRRRSSVPPWKGGSRALAVQSALGGARPSSPSATSPGPPGCGRRSSGRRCRLSGDPIRGGASARSRRDDVELAKLISGFLDAGLPRGELLEVLRVLSRGMAQTADATRRLVGNALLERGVSQDEVALRYIDATERLVPAVTELLRLQLRAHLRTGISQKLRVGRRAGHRPAHREPRGCRGLRRPVGYTRLGGQLPPEDVGRIAGRLAELAADTVRRPVTLVKMIGDAAMFVVRRRGRARDGGGTAYAADRRRRARTFPGCAPASRSARRTTRGGDWFGATVNLASRVRRVGQARSRSWPRRRSSSARQESPGTRRRRRRKVKGIDERVRLYALC